MLKPFLSLRNSKSLTSILRSSQVSVEVIAEGGENDLSVCDNMVTNVESFEVGEAEWKRCEASEE